MTTSEDDAKRHAAIQRFERQLNRSIDIRRVEAANPRDYEARYEPDEFEVIVRVTTAPIESMDVLDSASVLRSHMEDQAFAVDGHLVECDFPPRDRWHTKAPIFYFAVCF